MHRLGLAFYLFALSLLMACGAPPDTDGGSATPEEAHRTDAAGALDLSHELPEALRDWPQSVIRPRYSRDGSRIAFASNVEGTIDVFIADVATGEVRRLTEGPHDETRPTWSPDGRQVIVQSKRDGVWDLVVVDIADGSSRQITDDRFTESAPDWSPKGDLITYNSEANGSWDVWVVRPDGSEARAVTSHEGNEYQPKFSPDGSHITFYPTWHGWTDIAKVRVADGHVEMLLSSDHEDYRPTWSPDGRWIAFASDRSENGGLWAVPADGGEARPVFEGDVSVDYPDWRPDGKALIYIEDSMRSSLSLLTLATGELRQLTPGGLNVRDRHPDMAPGGQQLAFESNRYGNEGNVVLLDLASNEERRVSEERINDSSPRYSKDGHRLVFTRGGGDQADEQALILDLASGTTARWTDMKNVAYPAFCGPEALVFGWSEVAYTGSTELWRASEEGEASRVGGFVIERTGLDCTADGAQVVASLHHATDGEDLPRLVLIDLASGTHHVLTRGPGRHLHPRISPDGSRVAYVGEADGGFAAYAVDLSSRAVVELLPAAPDLAMVDWASDDALVVARLERFGRARLVSTRLLTEPN